MTTELVPPPQKEYVEAPENVVAEMYSMLYIAAFLDHGRDVSSLDLKDIYAWRIGENGEEEVDEDWLLHTFFYAKGKSESLEDDPYLMIDDKKLLFDSFEDGCYRVKSFELKNDNIEAFSIDNDGVSKIIKVKNLSYSLGITSVYCSADNQEMDVNLQTDVLTLSGRLDVSRKDANASFWDSSCILELTVDGVKKPTLRYDSDTATMYYGDYFFTFQE